MIQAMKVSSRSQERQLTYCYFPNLKKPMIPANTMILAMWGLLDFDLQKCKITSLDCLNHQICGNLWWQQ